MGLFSKGKSGGLMNVIRCDEEEYMVWKWRPNGQDVNSTSRENSIRYGSSLRVKDGEVAVFVYKQSNGTMQDFIVGPYDDTIKTANFPILSNIVGIAFGGESPFQAEVYFINLAGNNQMRFTIPYFDVFDPRLPDHGVPMAVRGTMTFNITDYKGFIKLNRLVNFDHEQFKKQIKDAITKYVKGDGASKSVSERDGFVLPEECGGTVMPEEVQNIFMSSAKTLDGMAMTGLAYLGSQEENGMNYAVLGVSETISDDPVKNVVIAVVNKNKKEKCSFVNINTLDLEEMFDGDDDGNDDEDDD